MIDKHRNETCPKRKYFTHLHTKKKSLYKAPVGFVSCWALKIVDDSSIMHAVPDVEWKWSCVARWCSSFVARDFGHKCQWHGSNPLMNRRYWLRSWDPHPNVDAWKKRCCLMLMFLLVKGHVSAKRCFWPRRCFCGCGCWADLGRRMVLYSWVPTWFSKEVCWAGCWPP